LGFIDNNVLANDIPQHFCIKVLGDFNFAHLELLSNDKQIGGMIVVQQWHKISSKVATYNEICNS
jgi:hypothetical protein